MNVNIVSVNGGKIPEYKTEGSVGADCYANETVIINPGEIKKIPLGFSVEIPIGYEMQIRPRSGLTNVGINAFLGTIDSDYRGEVCAILKNNTESAFAITKGDRICQAIISPVIIAKFNICEKLSETERGSNGFGSTGVN